MTGGNSSMMNSYICGLTMGPAKTVPHIIHLININELKCLCLQDISSTYSDFAILQLFVMFQDETFNLRYCHPLCVLWPDVLMCREQNAIVDVIYVASDYTL